MKKLNRSRSSFIIAFAGTVGSGKSTQMMLSAYKLKRKGLRVKTTYLKSGHLLAYLLGVILARMLTGKREDVYPVRALIEEKPGIFKKLFKLWLFFDIISVSAKFLLNIYIPLKLGYVMLVEEYLPAIIASYIYLEDKIADQTQRLFPLALKFMFKLLSLTGPMLAIFLDADIDTLKSRWRGRRSPYEKQDYLQMQRSILLTLLRKISSYKLLYINTSDQTIEETNKKIIDYLSSLWI